MSDYNQHINKITEEDSIGLRKARESYGDSWKNRGGVGAFMNLARKWDRIEIAVKKEGFDIFAVAKNDKRFESIMNDIRDLRRYLVLVEAEIRETVGHSKEDRDVNEWNRDTINSSEDLYTSILIPRNTNLILRVKKLIKEKQLYDTIIYLMSKEGYTEEEVKNEYFNQAGPKAIG